MRKLRLGLAAVLALVLAPAAYAQQEDDLDGLEMDVMESDATPNEASTRVLELPEPASDTARVRAQKGLDNANSAREDGKAFGEATAEAARERDGEHGPPGGTPGGRPEGTPSGPP